MTPEADRMLNPERPAERLEEKAARLEAEARASDNIPGRFRAMAILQARGFAQREAAAVILPVISDAYREAADEAREAAACPSVWGDTPAEALREFGRAFDKSADEAALVEVVSPAQAAAEDAWGAVWLHGKWRYLTDKMATPAKEYAADHVARWMAGLDAADGRPTRTEPEDLRWWRHC